MSEPVQVYIERVKAALGITTDDELSAKLGKSKQAIANWRKREKVPVEAEIELANMLGPNFAHDDLTREFVFSRENRIVYAATMYCFSHFEQSLERELTLEERLSLGREFQEVESLIRKYVRLERDEHPDKIILNVMMDWFRRGILPEVSSILSKAIKTKN
ncbi:helix-turn-helix domain-containing protein [Shinella sp. M27]|uniref:helix-turn-helix domain-containing protein n=1 Tax=Shinella sp. M27 TaxID=3368614 RepID=UPI003BA02D1F